MLWLAALAIGYLGPLFGGMSGWRVQPAHFVERHGLIVIIAIGESLIAIGLGARDTELSTGVIVAAVLGLAVTTSFWLAYFDFFPIRAQQLLADRSGAQRAALARDAYTYLHLPMVAGIVLFAFAMKTTLAHVGDELDMISAVGLCWGPALYLFAYVLLRLRVSRTLGRGRLVAAVACALLLPVAVAVPALLALTLVTAVWVALHAYEIIWWREARAQTRALRLPASLPVLTLTTLVAAALLTATSARAHPTGLHTGFQSTVSYIEPQLPGLLVQVLGGHEQLSVENLTQRNVVILDERGRTVVRIPPGRTRIWSEPRIGSAEPPPEREGLVRNWRIPGTADGQPFAIVGFLGYRPPASESNDGGVPMWAIAIASGASVLIVAAVLALPFWRREREGEQQESATER
jgi:hypothetical protein